MVTKCVKMITQDTRSLLFSMLLGNFQHSLDDKNRIRLPSKFREVLGSNYFMVPGTRGTIWLYPLASESDFMKMYHDVGEFNPQNNDAIRTIMSMGSLADADSQGRFMLPQELIDFAKINKDVRIIGLINKVEIWAEERYAALDRKNTPADIDNFYSNIDQLLRK